MDLIRQKKTAALVIAFAVLVGMLFAPTCESFAATNGSGTTVAPKKVTGLKAIRKSYNKIKINWKLPRRLIPATTVRLIRQQEPKL